MTPAPSRIGTGSGSAEVRTTLRGARETDFWRRLQPFSRSIANRSGAADTSAVGVGDGEGGAVEGRGPSGFVEHVVVVVAEEHEVRDDGGAVGERDDVVHFAVGAVAAGISAPALISEEHGSS